MAYYFHLPLLASRSCISFAASVPPFRPGERAMTERQGGESSAPTQHRNVVTKIYTNQRVPTARRPWRLRRR
jgi:hypothetical protein